MVFLKAKSPITALTGSHRQIVRNSLNRRACNTQTAWISRSKSPNHPAVLHWSDIQEMDLDVFPVYPRVQPATSASAVGIPVPELRGMNNGIHRTAGSSINISNHGVNGTGY